MRFISNLTLKVQNDEYANLLVVLLHVELYSFYVAGQDKYADAFKALGLRLKALRKKRGHTQEDMLSFGFSTRHWQQVEAGRSITLKTLFRACDVLDIRPELLLKGLYEPTSIEDRKTPQRR
jgi:DNA-binding Xre family transcriptional regulator